MEEDLCGVSTKSISHTSSNREENVVCVDVIIKGKEFIADATMDVGGCVSVTGYSTQPIGAPPPAGSVLVQSSVHSVDVVESSQGNTDDITGESSRGNPDDITDEERPTVDTFQKGLMAAMGLLNKMSEEDKRKAMTSMEQLLKGSVTDDKEAVTPVHVQLEMEVQTCNDVKSEDDSRPQSPGSVPLSPWKEGAPVNVKNPRKQVKAAAFSRKLTTVCDRQYTPKRGRPRKSEVKVQSPSSEFKEEEESTVTNSADVSMETEDKEEIGNTEYDNPDESVVSSRDNTMDETGADWLEEQSQQKLNTVDKVEPVEEATSPPRVRRKPGYKPDKNVLEFLKKTKALKSRRKKRSADVEVKDESADESVNRASGSEAEPESPTATPDREEEIQLDIEEPNRVVVNDFALYRRESGNWQCGECNRLFQFRGLGINHLRTHITDRPFKCDLCNKGFKYQTNKFRHIRDVHKANPIVCGHCDMTFGTRRELVTHVWDQHNIRMSGNSSLDCAECGKTFNNRSSYKSHMTYKHSSVKPEFTCEFCDRVFGFQSNLIRHKKIHTGETPHKCEYCTAGFIERKSLMLHMMKSHDNPQVRAMLDVCQKYRCPEAGCGKEFMNSGNLLTHRRVHTQEKPFNCSYCQRAFSIKSNLKRHEATHRGERPYPCPECHKRFTEKRSMQIHYRLHTGEKPYSCDVCQKRFAQLGTLNAHKPVHSKERKHRCGECGETFLRPSHLSIHKRKHGSGPQLPCHTCDAMFYRKSDLTRHEQSHYPESSTEGQSSAMMFRCKICDQLFPTQPEIYRHQMDEHGGHEALNDIHSPPMALESAQGGQMAESEYRVLTSQEGYQADGDNTYKIIVPQPDGNQAEIATEYTIQLQIETDSGTKTVTPTAQEYEDLVAMRRSGELNAQQLVARANGSSENYVVADITQHGDSQHIVLIREDGSTS